jgi:hypothetical protein
MLRAVGGRPSVVRVATVAGVAPSKRGKGATLHGRRGNFAAVRAGRRMQCMLPVSLGLCGTKELSCAARRATWPLTELSNVVAYACRHSRAEDRRHAHRSAFFGCPSTGDQSFSHQRFPSVKTGCANCANPAMGRPSGTRDWHSGSGNCGNPYRRPAPATSGTQCQATAERWVRWR